MHIRAPHIEVCLSTQQLKLRQGIDTLFQAPVSTALNGPGEERDSGCTPRGWFKIYACIGGDCPAEAVFVGRLPTGEIYSPDLAAAYPERDWILSRILWLSGLEPGKNCGGSVDTLHRYIYIHGTPLTEPMGVPRSHGCIRMHTPALLDLFAKVEVGTLVHIYE